MGTVPLNESGSVTLNGSGNGTVRMRPFGGGETWLPGSVSFKASSNTLEASCRIYIGPSPSDQYFVDGSLSGSTGDSTGRVAGYQVDSHGNYLWAVWAGGDAGATATVQVTGTEVTPGSGSPFDLSQLPVPGSGCSNPLVGGGGALVYPSIHSPNFVIANPVASPSPSWAILKSGLAYFFGLVLTGGTITGPDYIFNTQGLFFYSGTPAAGNLIISLVGPGVVADPKGNTVKPDGLTIYGPAGQDIFLGLGAVSGNSQLQFLSGAAIEGQASALVTAISGAGATEFLQIALEGPALNVAGLTDWMTMQVASSNQGGTTLAEILFSYVNNAQVAATILNINNLGLGLFNTAAPAAVAGRAGIFASNSNLDFVSGADGNTYATGRLTKFTTANQPVTTGIVAVTGLQFTVQPGTYEVKGKIRWQQGATAAAQNFQLAGPAISLNAIEYAHYLHGSGISNGVGAYTGALGTNVASPAFAAGATMYLDLDGIVTFTAGGTFGPAAGETIGGDPFTILAGSKLALMPVS